MTLDDLGISMCCRGRTAREEGAADRGAATGDDDGMMHSR